MRKIDVSIVHQRERERFSNHPRSRRRQDEGRRRSPEPVWEDIPIFRVDFPPANTLTGEGFFDEDAEERDDDNVYDELYHIDEGDEGEYEEEEREYLADDYSVGEGGLRGGDAYYVDDDPNNNKGKKPGGGDAKLKNFPNEEYREHQVHHHHHHPRPKEEGHRQRDEYYQVHVDHNYNFHHRPTPFRPNGDRDNEYKEEDDGRPLLPPPPPLPPPGEDDDDGEVGRYKEQHLFEDQEKEKRPKDGYYEAPHHHHSHHDDHKHEHYHHGGYEHSSSSGCRTSFGEFHAGGSR